MRVRVAAAIDQLRLIQLINAAFSVETFLQGARTDRRRLAAMMAKGRILMAEDSEGRPLASVYIERRGKRGYLACWPSIPQQGKGLGRRMVEAAEERLRQQGCKAVDIAVLSLRPELLPLYRRFGYLETGSEEFKPSRPLRPGVECHCIVMSKRL